MTDYDDFKQFGSTPAPKLPRKGCGHGKRFDEPCRECEIIFEMDCLATFERRAAECRERLAQLRAEQQ